MLERTDLCTYTSRAYNLLIHGAHYTRHQRAYTMNGPAARLSCAHLITCTHVSTAVRSAQCTSGSSQR
jgi:hypothetical protein